MLFGVMANGQAGWSDNKRELLPDEQSRLTTARPMLGIEPSGLEIERVLRIERLSER